MHINWEIPATKCNFFKKKKLKTLVLFVSLWIDYVHQIVNLCYSKDFSHRSNLLQSKDLARRWRLDIEEECAIPRKKIEKKICKLCSFWLPFPFLFLDLPSKGLSESHCESSSSSLPAIVNHIAVYYSKCGNLIILLSLRFAWNQLWTG